MTKLIAHDSLPLAFGYQSTWLAVRGSNLKDVSKALPLVHAHETSWRDGLASVYDFERRVFVSPPVAGFIFVVSGLGLPAITPGAEDQVVPFVARLSKDLNTEVQYFSTHRVVELHAWALAIRGTVSRAFAYVGESNETPLDLGPLTPTEAALGDRALRRPTEDVVMRVAAGWGIDPQALEDYEAEPNLGLLGTLPPQTGDYSPK